MVGVAIVVEIDQAAAPSNVGKRRRSGAGWAGHVLEGAVATGFGLNAGAVGAVGDLGPVDLETADTLHVGAGTFQSLRHEDIEANRLHSERLVVDRRCCDLVRQTQEEGGRVIAVGTTSVRALETAARGGTIEPYSGETDLFILPGYEFRSIDAMITNFHLPQSSLLMLVAAFAGTGRILDAYRHAVAERYRFFSYGDSMFLTPEPGA
mgnify:CR=1 FL=1